jgi:hypothetical protein
MHANNMVRNAQLPNLEHENHAKRWFMGYQSALNGEPVPNEEVQMRGYLEALKNCTQGTPSALGLPHPVPSAELQSVLIRDGSHRGTVVTNLGELGGFLFSFLDGGSPKEFPRCVLVRLAAPEHDGESGREVSTWQDALPAYCATGVDLDGVGYLLLGCDDDLEDLDEHLGEVLWDSAAG